MKNHWNSTLRRRAERGEETGLEAAQATAIDSNIIPPTIDGGNGHDGRVQRPHVAGCKLPWPPGDCSREVPKTKKTPVPKSRNSTEVAPPNPRETGTTDWFSRSREVPKIKKTPVPKLTPFVVAPPHPRGVPPARGHVLDTWPSFFCGKAPDSATVNTPPAVRQPSMGVDSEGASYAGAFTPPPEPIRHGAPGAQPNLNPSIVIGNILFFESSTPFPKSRSRQGDPARKKRRVPFAVGQSGLRSLGDAASALLECRGSPTPGLAPAAVHGAVDTSVEPMPGTVEQTYAHEHLKSSPIVPLDRTNLGGATDCMRTPVAAIRGPVASCHVVSRPVKPEPSAGDGATGPVLLSNCTKRKPAKRIEVRVLEPCLASASSGPSSTTATAPMGCPSKVSVDLNVAPNLKRPLDCVDVS